MSHRPEPNHALQRTNHGVHSFSVFFTLRCHDLSLSLEALGHGGLLVEVLLPNSTRFAAVSTWFGERRAEQWDRQIEQDALTGKLDHLAEAALAKFRVGRFTRLP